MNLYMVHVGYKDIDSDVYEHHTNIFIVADDKRNACRKAKGKEQFIKKNMHIDGVMQIKEVDGYRITLKKK